MTEKEHYSFGRLNPKQRQVVSSFVRGRTVHDVGAGELALSRQLAALGAREVIAIESATKELGLLEYGLPVTVVPLSFKQYGRVARREKAYARAEERTPGGPARPIQVAFLSWPSAEDSKFKARSDYSVLGIVRRAPIVIYLGSNMDGVMCGSRKLYEHLARRRVLAHEPAPHNTLIVYDGLLAAGKSRELLPEETAGLDPDRIYRYAEEYRTVTAKDLIGKP